VPFGLHLGSFSASISGSIFERFWQRAGSALRRPTGRFGSPFGTILGAFLGRFWAHVSIPGFLTKTYYLLGFDHIPTFREGTQIVICSASFSGDAPERLRSSFLELGAQIQAPFWGPFWHLFATKICSKNTSFRTSDLAGGRPWAGCVNSLFVPLKLVQIFL